MSKGFINEFKEFAIKGNMIDLAVGVIIGAAFGKIIDSIVKDVIMPIVNFILGGSVDFANKFIVLSEPDGYAGPRTYEAMSKAGANLLAYGNFLTIFINFLLLALVIFCLIKAIKNNIRKCRCCFFSPSPVVSAMSSSPWRSQAGETYTGLSISTNSTFTPNCCAMASPRACTP